MFEAAAAAPCAPASPPSPPPRKGEGASALPVASVACGERVQLQIVDARGCSAAQGQAFVVFKDTSTATKALRGMQGFEFFDCKLVCRIASPFSQSRALPCWSGGCVLPRLSPQSRTWLIHVRALRRHQNIQFAKGKSDCVAKLDGTWVPKYVACRLHSARKRVNAQWKYHRSWAFACHGGREALLSWHHSALCLPQGRSREEEEAESRRR